MFRHLLCLMLFLSTVFCARGNNMKGTEFWFGYMENLSNPQGIIAEVAINSDITTTGTISIPGAGWIQNFNVSANSSVQITLPSALVQNIGNMTIGNTGVYIQTQDSVYVSINSRVSGSTDASAILPLYALGYDHYASTYIDPPNTNWGTPEVLIVATEDNTLVNIAPSGNLSNQQSAAFTVTLNKGQCYQIQSYWGNGSIHNGNDLSGTLVQSICNSSGVKHPIAVFSGDVCSLVGGVNCSGCDHLLEQVYDYKTWGTAFPIVPPMNRNDYKLKIVAAYNGTTISGGNFANQTINAGQSIELNLSGEEFITSNQAISVALITYGQACSVGYGDPMMSYIPAVDHFTNAWRYQSFDDGSGMYLNYLTIITAASNANNIYLDGANVPGTNFSPHGINPNYVWTTLPMATGTIAHDLNSTGGFIALPHGYTGAASYYLNSGLGLKTIQPSFDLVYLQDTVDQELFDDTICACEPITFIADYFDPAAIIDWDFGDGSFGQGFNATHDYLNGVYDVTLFLRDNNGCIIDSIIKQNLVVVNCDINMSSLDTLCIGESVTLTANTGSTFVWSTGETTPSITVSPNSTTSYSLQIDGGSNPICDSIIVYVHPEYIIGLDDTLKVCEPDTAFVHAPTGLASYNWSNGSSADHLETTNSGEYSLIVEDSNGCLAYDTIVVEFYTPSTWSLGPDIIACEGQSVDLNGPVVSNANYLWSSNETTAAISVDETGSYSLVVDDGVCINSDSVYVLFNRLPTSSLPSAIDLCENELLLDPKSEELNSYIWSTGENTASIIVNESGSYWVEISNNCGTLVASIDVLFDCEFQIYVPNSFTPDSDGINDAFGAIGVGIVEYELRIYDRWGEQVFFSASLSDQWDGSFRGQEAKSDVYVWIVKVVDVLGRNHQRKGHVTLSR